MIAAATIPDRVIASSPSAGSASLNQLCLHLSAAFALDLSRQPHGYLAEAGPAIDALREAGLITTKDVGCGYLIARAVVVPAKRESAMNWRWYRQFRAAVAGEGANA